MRILALIPLLAVSFCLGKPKPEISEVIVWFEAHYTVLKELKEIGINHKSLKRAAPALRRFTDYYFEPNEKDKIAEEKAFRLVEKLGVDFVSYSRKWPDDEELIAVSIPYWSVGLLVGGKSVMIEYFEKEETVEKIIEHGSACTALGKKGWFIVETDH